MHETINVHYNVPRTFCEHFKYVLSSTTPRKSIIGSGSTLVGPNQGNLTILRNITTKCFLIKLVRYSFI